MSSTNGAPAAPAAIPDAARLREIAVRAEADPRTVAKFLEDEDVRPSVARRIERALADFAREDAERTAAAQAATERQSDFQSRLEAAKAAGLNDGVARIFAASGFITPSGMRVG